MPAALWEGVMTNLKQKMDEWNRLKNGPPEANAASCFREMPVNYDQAMQALKKAAELIKEVSEAHQDWRGKYWLKKWGWE